MEQRRRVEFPSGLNPAAIQTPVRSLSTPTPRVYRQRRHSTILAAVHRFDARIDHTGRAELARSMRDIYENEIGDVPLGFVAQCHLGPPYVDHRLDLLHSIVDHFAPADVMPEPYSAARMMVRTGAYAFIEVYASGRLCPVRDDGSVVA